MKLYEAYPYSSHYFCGGAISSEIEDYIPKDDTSVLDLVSPSAEWWYWISSQADAYYDSLLQENGVSNFYPGEHEYGEGGRYRYPDVDSKYANFDKYRRDDELHDYIIFNPYMCEYYYPYSYTKDQIEEWADNNAFLIRPLKAPLIEKLVRVSSRRSPGAVTARYWEMLQDAQIGLELIRILPTTHLFCRYIWLNTRAECVVHRWYDEGVDINICSKVIDYIPLYECVFMGDVPYNPDAYCEVSLEYRDWLRKHYEPLRFQFRDGRRKWENRLYKDIVSKFISL